MEHSYNMLRDFLVLPELWWYTWYHTEVSPSIHFLFSVFFRVTNCTRYTCGPSYQPAAVSWNWCRDYKGGLAKTALSTAIVSFKNSNCLQWQPFCSLPTISTQDPNVFIGSMKLETPDLFPLTGWPLTVTSSTAWISFKWQIPSHKLLPPLPWDLHAWSTLVKTAVATPYTL